MKRHPLLLAALSLMALAAQAQEAWTGYEVKAENAYTRYEVRYATNPKDMRHYDTSRLRGEYLVSRVFVPGEVNWTYTTFERFLIGGAEPTGEPLRLTSIAPLYPEKGAGDSGRNLLDNRELGLINLGGPGTVTVDGKRHDLGFQDALYVGRGAKDIVVESRDAARPAKFYMNSAPAHATYPTVKVAARTGKQGEAVPGHLLNGAEGVRTCQLQMGVAVLKDGQVWNTMPPHVHIRRMETYFYYGLADGQRVCHILGEPQETRIVWADNCQAVVNPEWSVHFGAGTGSYSFVWSMAGENLVTGDRVAVPLGDVR